jgi:hypothetical protein
MDQQNNNTTMWSSAPPSTSGPTCKRPWGGYQSSHEQAGTVGEHITNGCTPPLPQCFATTTALVALGPGIALPTISQEIEEGGRGGRRDFFCSVSSTAATATTTCMDRNDWFEPQKRSKRMRRCHEGTSATTGSLLFNPTNGCNSVSVHSPVAGRRASDEYEYDDEEEEDHGDHHHDNGRNDSNDEMKEQQQQSSPTIWWRQRRFATKILYDEKLCHVCQNPVVTPPPSAPAALPYTHQQVPRNTLHNYFATADTTNSSRSSSGTHKCASVFSNSSSSSSSNTRRIGTSATSPCAAAGIMDVTAHDRHSNWCCTFCERRNICSDCMYTCEDCHLPFCSFCSTTDAQNSNGAVCFDCAATVVVTTSSPHRATAATRANPAVDDVEASMSYDDDVMQLD